MTDSSKLNREQLKNLEDPRLGDIIQFTNSSSQLPSLQNKYGVALVGFPFDEGVKRNGGRIGSAQGPSAVRKLMSRMGTVFNSEYNFDLTKIEIFDCGNIEPSSHSTLEEAHSTLEKNVTDILEKNFIPFVVGGGNDESYPNASGLLNFVTKKTLGSMGVINIDAHLDVRPLKNNQVHSGSPFRLLLEDKRFDGKYFVEFASQGNQCSAKHANFIQGKEGRIFWLKDIKENAVQKFTQILDSLGDNIFVSFDLDSVCARDAPGVSAPGSIGLSSEDAIQICYAAGKHPKVKLFDLSEYNPVVDEYCTGKLVVNMFYFFLAGVSERNK